MAVSANIFKNLGKSMAYTSLDVMTSLMPNTAEIIRGLRSGVDATRDFVRTNQAKLQVATRQNDRGVGVKRAKGFLADAWEDIKKGNLALGDLAEESFDDFDNFMNESEKSSQITYSDKDVQDQENGQVVPPVQPTKLVSTDFRTLKGLRHMTDTLGKTQLKAAEYQTERVTQSIFTSMSLNQQHFGIIEKQLDSINKNLMSLVKFQSESQAATNKAHLVFYDQVTSWMKKQEKREVDRSRRTRSVTRSKSQQFLGNQWFDANAYKELVKENFQNSAIGMAANMISMVDPALLGMMMGGGYDGGKIQPQKFLLQGMMKAMMPRAAHRSVARFDNQVNTMLKTVLSRAGSYWQTPNVDKHPLLSMLGTIFGVDSSARRSLRLGNYNRGEMNWNGEAQRVLVNVIPKQLSEIKAAILKTEPEYYDSKTGKFQNMEQVRARTRRAFQNSVETPFANMFNRDDVTLNPDDAANRKYWQSLSDDVRNQISSIVNEAVRNEVGLTTDMTKKIDQMINEQIKSLGGTLTDTQRIVTSLAEGVNQARSNAADFIKTLQEQDSAFAQVADSLANENGILSFGKLMEFLNADSINLTAANGGRYAWNGKRYDEMTPEERRRFDNQRGQITKTQQWIRNLSRSDNKWARRAGKGINAAYNFYTGRGGKHAQRVGNFVDRVSNELYRATMLGETPDFKRRGAASTSASQGGEEDYGEGDDGSGPSPHPKPGNSSNRSQTGGRIVNTAYEQAVNEDPNSSQSRIVKAVEKSAEYDEAANGPKGFMRKWFDNPLLKKALDWLSKSKLGQAAKAKAGEAGKYIKSVFTEGYTDSKGKYHKSVKEELSDTGIKASKAVGKMLGIDIDTGKVDESSKEENTVKDAVENLSEGINEATETVTGESGDQKKASGRKDRIKKQTSSLLKKLNDAVRKNAPRIIKGGVIGGLAGAAMGGSTGLIGGLFLPGGPIGGAIAGMGISIISQSELFKKIVFGEKDEKTGERDGGLISKKLRDSFKANLPKMVKGAAVGVAAKFLLGNIGGPVGALGVVPSMLLPGGIMGAAIMGAGASLMIGNEHFMETVFGKKDKDGKRTGAALSGVYNKATELIKGGKDKDGKKKKGLVGKLFSGLKGAAAGAITAATISQFGLLGSMLTPGGPIGGALLGAALNISGVGDKFNDFLFGKKDKDGKIMKNGLFSRMGKAFEMNVVDPAKNWIKYTGEQFAWWAKEKIEVPFRLAFGPILDSFTAAKDAIVDTVKGGVKEVAKKTGSAIYKILAPVGNLFKKAVLAPLGKVAGGLLKGTLFAAGSLVGSPFQALALLMSGKRRKGQKKFGDYLKSDKEGILQSYWDRRRESGQKVNEFGDRLMYNLGTLPGVGQFFRSNEMMADIAEQFEGTPEGKGMNHLDWLGAGADKKKYKANRKASRKEEKRENNLLKLRRKFASSERYDEAFDYGLLDPEELKSRYKALKKYGVNISTPDELKQFVYHYDEWKNPKAAEANKAANPAERTAKATERLVEIAETGQQLQKEANDIAKASLDAETGSVVDTEDIDPGDLADEMDEDKAEEVQEKKAGIMARAWAKVQNFFDRKKKREATHAQVTGNTSGGDFTDFTVDEDGNVYPKAVTEEPDDSLGKQKGGSGFLGSLAGGLVSKFLGGGILKAGLVAALIGALANPEVITAVGNLLGKAIKAIPGLVKDAVTGLGKGFFEGLGLTDEDKDRTYYDENGNEKKILNTNMVQDVATIALNPKSAAKGAVTMAKTAAHLVPGGGLAVKGASKVWSGVKSTADKVGRMATGEGSIIAKALNYIKGLILKLADTKIGKAASGLLSPLTKFFDDILKTISKSSGKIADLIAAKAPALSAAMAKMGITTGSGFSPAAVINVGIAAYSAINGAVHPERLFKIDKKYVDGTMRTISAIFEAITGYFGAGAVLELTSEIINAATGFDFLQSLALLIYHVVAGDDDDAKIDQAVAEFKVEVENYNEANNTNLSSDAYNDLKNKSILGNAWNGIKKLFGGGDKTEYSQYEVSNYNQSTGNGTGALGYGPGMQGDRRWANMKLGKFPNGKTSTMATAGCGPTALANAANKLGVSANPGAVGAYAVNNGFISQGGANDGLFEEGARGMGLATKRVRNEDDIRKSLRAGKPVIMAGKSSGYGSTPYTAAGHIVTATGLDGAGNVIVDDPMRGTGKYRLRDMKDKMTAGWSVARGYGLISGLFGDALSKVATEVGANFLSSKTGLTLEEAKARLAAGASDDPSNPDTSMNAATGSIPVEGNAKTEQNWNYLKSKGYSDIAAAAIMGNWQAESHNDASTIEGYFLKSFPGTKQVLSSNQALDNYTTQILFPAYKKTKINKNAYKGTDGHYYPGIGLAQWTGPRGERLFKYANQNGLYWGDQGAQLEFFNSEVEGGRINKGTLNAKKDIAEATEYFTDNYEQHKGYSKNNKSNFNNRLGYAKSFLNQYGAATGYGLYDAMFGDTMSQLASGVGTKILSGMLGISEEEAAQRYNGGNTADSDTTSGGQNSATGSGLVFPATGNAKKDQQNLVKQMDSIKGTLRYSLNSGEQDPDKGVASCASTVAWAYDKVLGFKPGGSRFASSTGQSTDPHFTTIYQNNGTPLDVSVLQPGDIMYQNWDTTKYNGTVQHTEMYAGGGKDLSHGGNPSPGPTYKDLNDYRLQHTMLVRRYTPFIDSDTNDTKQDESLGNGLGMDAFRVSKSGTYQHNDQLATGYGPGIDTAVIGASNKGVESRLDVIISLLRSLASKKPGAATTTNNLNVNYGQGETKVSKPTVIVNNPEHRQLGKEDAQNQYLRAQHRKLAMAIHS